MVVAMPADTNPTITSLPAGPHRREFLVSDQLRVIFDRMVSTANGLQCWVEIRSVTQTPPPRLLAAGRFDLMSSRTIPGLVRACETTADTRHPFARILTDIIFERVIPEHLEGVPPVDLVDVRPAAGKWLIRPLIASAKSTSILAPGGVGKSMLALAAGLTVCTGRTGFLGLKPLHTGPVLYLDWESTAEEQTERMRALCAGAGVPLPDPGMMIFRAGTGPLAGSSHEIARIVAQLGAQLVIVDSVMLARQGDAFGPEDTTRLFAALADLGAPTLLVDHKSREAIRKGWKGAFGSVVNDNTLRLSWEVVADSQTSPTTRQVRFENVKHNNVARQPDLAFEFRTESDTNDTLRSLRIRPVAADVIRTLEERPLADRILAELQARGGATVAELVEATGKSAATIRGRLSNLGGQVSKQGEVWTLTADREALPAPW